ncbi:hypothetical protein MPTK1_4g23490 [Marchantia polymorpha subsp. ruderalis]|uniref:AB hydrolase-1 domain-containing protein n=2 Tax=Marchantia polymorpha TaxID=3197 RepID=A0A176VMU5_MARPO|nr:hypothetical protein AXG93_939s1410 [Marchantia polymorpha subsp. ruderalis]PTQ44460.1 hypothetical protein MARPO_0020s0112 [Marchantia polymorpha]BBN09883.1 hypothetical protein Mp_4g23490 [Marchantia polymorpha subsp. ruderalis]|eukprot:PTQ44460.1 hypothetical protein MARPO_0020s0112 [Marchantia polymorpha]
MGNQIACMAKGMTTKKGGKKTNNNSHHRGKIKGVRKGSLEEEVIQQQALALALQQHQKAQMRLERTMSQRMAPGPLPPSSGKLPRSASTRARSITDPVVHPQQLINGALDEKVLQSLETKHFVLVHGGGHGAWCWYKTIALLEEAGFTASAIDLTGSGRDYTDPNTITSLAHYVKPLFEFLENLSENDKVILVGHNVGGACISYAMEQHPKKIAKAIFVAAAMVINGQRAFDVFASQPGSGDDLLQKAQSFIYANGNTSAPTALEVDKNLIRDVFYNASPAKDIALATVSIRPVPFAPLMEKLTLTSENYGSVRRFFIGTTEDNALPGANQEAVLQSNPPEKSFKVKGSDHAPFFSKPQAFHKILVEIAMLGAKS